MSCDAFGHAAPNLVTATVLLLAIAFVGWRLRHAARTARGPGRAGIALGVVGLAIVAVPALIVLVAGLFALGC
ncbi:hypothetical protein OJ997_20150 [Solirubrobacter phytolaccae]|uniref:Uncharacterized protein n=1 Tax=Solirubrobacter phytolaccae TaxID=1404360 RepID=A0A9X3NCL1_9ACTN|nr:hypothetical protein [Solirubrobacter phytolaccae]MDA0182634.1 hypothetical protein [Solirubrobacter phytolaccae]